jgi:hypothetical protein
MKEKLTQEECAEILCAVQENMDSNWLDGIYPYQSEENILKFAIQVCVISITAVLLIMNLVLKN